MFQFLTRITRQVIFFGLCLFALAISLVRILVLCVDLYKTELEIELSQLLATPVSIGHINAYMRGFNPEVILKNISLPTETPQQNHLQLKEIRLGINVFKMLFNQNLLTSSWITLVGAKLSVIRQIDGSFEIDGLKSSSGQPLWLLEGESYQILDSDITWLDKKRQGKVITFKNVDLVIKNQSEYNHHQARLLVKSPNKYGKKLRILVDFTGNIFQPDDLVGQIFIEGQNIQFAELITGDLPLKLKLETGTGSFKLWGFWQKNQLTSVSGWLKTEKLKITNKFKQRLSIQQLKTNFIWENNNNQWLLAVKDLATTLNGTQYPQARFSIGSNNKHAQHFSANIQQLDLGQFTVLQKFFSPLFVETPKLFSQFKLRGQLQNSRLFADLKQQHYSFNTQFKQVSMSGLKNLPEWENLSGSMSGNQKQGQIKLQSKNAHFIAKDLFRQPLKIKQLQGIIDWQQQDKSLVLSSRHLQLNSPYFKSFHQFKITLPNDKSPFFMDLQSSALNLKKVSQLKRYFPITLMSPELITWLDNAFISGVIPRLDLSFYGHPQDFPFKQHQGVFQVLFSPENAELNYAPQWPHFKSLFADVMFLNDSLEIKLKRGKAMAMRGKQFTVEIPSLSKDTYLYAKGQLNGRINHGLNFLQHTPLDLPIVALRKALSFKGSTKIDLDLSLPLNDLASTRVKGVAKLNQAQFNVSAINVDVKRIKGQLHFSEKGVFAKKISAQAFSQSIQMTIDSDDTNTTINVDGKVSAEKLLEKLGVTKQKIVSGLTDYQLQLTLPQLENRLPHLKINSDLRGIEINLPDNLAKNATQKKTLSIQTFITSEKEALLPIKINYGKDLNADIRFHKSRQRLYSGNILVGQGQVKKPHNSGLNIQINSPQFSLNQWLNLINQDSQGSSESIINHINIETPHLQLQQQNLGVFRLNFQRQSHNWQGTFSSSIATGSVEIPLKNLKYSKIKLNLDCLNLSLLDKLSLPKQSAQQSKNFPLIDIKSQQLLWRGVNLGQLKVKTQRSDYGVKFEHIFIKNKQQQLALSGDWQYQNGQHRTHLQGRLKSENFGKLLNKLDFSKQFEETSATINFDFNWQAAPYQLSFTQLNGSLNLQLDEGRLLGIEPGLGRLLGVLAMEQWIKRLQFDFDDLYKEGLSFNQISGQFSLNKGIADNDNLVMDAIPAKVILKGKLDLTKQTLDQEVAVIPKSSSAIPIAGTIIGGIATAIAQTVTGEYEEGYYLRSKYQLAGHWNDLKITPLYEQDGLLKKTWRGLTDFSWLEQQE